MSDRPTPAGMATPTSRRFALLAALLAFLLAGAAALGVVRQSEQSRLLAQRANLSDLAGNHGHAIERNVDRALSATYALAALVRQGQGAIANFEATASAMLPYYPGAASLQLAPDGIVRQIVPLAGNEKALGHNLLKDPTREKEAFLARDTGTLTLAGPFELMQGGLGAVGRLPVFLDQGSQAASFWGFTTVLIRFPQVLENADLVQLVDHGVGFELWRVHPDSGKRQRIAASSENALIDPVSQVLDMPNGRWTLSLAPRQGWGDPFGLAIKSALGLLFSLLLGYLAWLLVKQQEHKKSLESTVLSRTAEISATQAKLQAAFDAIPDLIWLKDLQSVYQDCNAMFERLLGDDKSAILGKTDFDFFDPPQADAALARDRRVMTSGQNLSHEEWSTFADGGQRRLFEITRAPWRDEAGQVIGVLCIGRDITERRAAVAKIEYLTQIYAALSQCNQAIVRCSNQTDLFAQICRDVVQFGGLKMAWIGLIGTDSDAVMPTASAGEGQDFLQGLKISTNADDPYGQGPTGTAIRTQQPVWVQDYLNDASTTTWREQAAPFGWAGVAALPLLLRGRVVAVFNLYAGQTNAFEPQVRDLLEEMAADISFALEGYAREAERQQAIAALSESEERYRALIEWTPEAVIVHREGKILYANPAAVKLFGATQARELMGKTTTELVHPNFRQQQTQRMQNLINKVPMEPMVESQFLRLDGTGFDVEVQGTAIVYAGQQAIHVLVRDITARKKAQEQFHLAASVFTHAREGIMITATDGTIIDANDAFSTITGYSREEALGQNPRMLSSGRQSKEYYAALWRDLVDKGYWYGEVWNRRKNGEVYAGMQTISAVRDAQGKTRHYVALFSDITALKDHQQQLEHMAHFDALTDLPNRVLLAERLHRGMAQALRHGQLLAVAFLDLDGFKGINDKHGHEAGDQLLIALATRLKLSLREGDSLGRIGGDEFVAVLPDLNSVNDSAPMLERLLAAAAEPIPYNNQLLQISASVGVTFYPQASDIDADQLLRQADQAMYQAKLSGKNRYHLFDAEQDRSVRGLHENLERIRRALRSEEFVLYYQPKVNMRTGAIVGAEALIRWQHPEQGLLSPASFLPAIENHPLAIELGEWVIATALLAMVRWRIGGLDLPVSVNIGASQLQQSDFVQRLKSMLAAQPQVRPGDLELEVLETSALEDLVHVSRVIESCREIGVTFALDDFGTGYSSLTYLKRLAVTLLKIDQSFVRDMLDHPDDLAILDGVIGLAKSFHREVIAEGVESVAHGTMLLQFGCELGQGYGIARPMLAMDLPAWAAHWRPDPAWLNRAALNRDELALLFAGVEHRAWFGHVQDYLQGKGEAPSVDQQQCGLGKWFETHRHSPGAARSAFAAADTLHQQAHALSQQLCELHSRGHASQALARISELHDLRDALQSQLNELITPTPPN